jgi:hypothetical protein
MAQDVFRDAFRRIEANELAVLSIGDVTKRSMLVRYGLPEDVGIRELRAAGAVCDIVGQFIDAHGRPIRHPLNRRAIALPLDHLARGTTVVFAAGGAHKIRAVAAVLRGGLWLGLRDRRSDGARRRDARAQRSLSHAGSPGNTFVTSAKHLYINLGSAATGARTGVTSSIESTGWPASSRSRTRTSATPSRSSR